MSTAEEVRKNRNFVRQFSVMLPNRVGAFSALLNLLSRREINVIGLSVQDSRDATVARLIVDDPDTAEELFMEQGIAFTLSELVVVSMKESGSDLRNCLRVLYEAETNLDYTFSLMVQHKGKSLLAMYLEDCEFGATVLNQAGITVVYEDELCR
ncbi:ACT domain-containing protein [Verrucomicrobiaceae bacterium 227]